MKTIKLPFKTDNPEFLIDLQRQYTILLKSGYNRLLEGMADKEIRLYLKNLDGVKDLDSRFIENVILDIKGFQRENKMIFRRKNFNKRSKDKISKEEFKRDKYLPIVNYGEKSVKGNRKFKIDLFSNKIIFKLNRNKHIDLILPSLKNNLNKELFKIQELMENNKISISFKIDKNQIYISYDPPVEQEIILKDNRILGIDLNPNWLGLSILEFNGYNYEVIHKSSIDLTKINKFKTNKKNYELIIVSKQIVNLMKSFNVGNISIEDLSIVSKNHNKGRRLNKLLNGWNRNLLVNNLIKRCKIEGIKVYNPNAAYSSIIGNLQHSEFDPVNASIEIARRGYLFCKMFIKEKFYPKFELKEKWNQWKEETCLFFEGWIDFYKHLKTLKMKYRVPIEQVGFTKKCIKRIDFCLF
jgi:IS605 OrfB family transposase